MFKGLKRKLTLINTTILVVFLMGLVSIVYLYMNHGLIRDMDHRLAAAAGRVQALDQLPPERPKLQDGDPGPDGPDDNKPRESLKMIWVLRNHDLQVTAITPDSGRAAEISLEQAKKVLAENQAQAVTLNLDGETVRIFSLPYNKNGVQGVVQVIQSVAMEWDFLANLMSLLIVLGLAGILPAAAAGWYLAGKALIPIKKSWQQQQDFVSDASHELRTPLTVVQANLEVAMGNTDSSLAENQVWLNNALAETKRMGKLINELLLLAEADAQQVLLDPQLFDLSATARETAKQMRPLLESAGLSFKQAIAPDLIAVGDEQRIRQLLVILLDNARKYTPSGGQVSLEMTGRPGKVEIQVADSGVGIAAADLEKIFQRFYRVDKARSRAQGGSGLGLAIADWIVQAHGGKNQGGIPAGSGQLFYR